MVTFYQIAQPFLVNLSIYELNSINHQIKPMCLTFHLWIVKHLNIVI